MKHKWILDRCGAFGRALAMVLALFCAAPAQELANRITQTDAESIRAIAATLAPRADRADDVLKSLKFSAVAETIPGFAEWPALRKIETAYLSAVEGGWPSRGREVPAGREPRGGGRPF
jgi:hypothetical protein